MGLIIYRYQFFSCLPVLCKRKIKFLYLFLYQLNIFTKVIILGASHQIHHLLIDSILNQILFSGKDCSPFHFSFFSFSFGLIQKKQKIKAQ
jgi:hypothetical protein